MQLFSGAEYLLIDISNCMGQDKELWDVRINYAKELLERCDTTSYIETNAKEPLLCKKAVRAYQDCLDGIPTGHIMGMDAVNSGLQILACFLGCHSTAEQCGLVDTGKRESGYVNVASIMCDMFGCNVTGDEVKKPLMTCLYGSKLQPKLLFGEDTPELEAFYTTLNELFPGAVEAMDDILGCWQRNVLVHEWEYPDKHTASVKVMHTVEKKINVSELGGATFTHRAQVNLTSEQADLIEASGQYIEKDTGISILANIVQGCDAYIVREMLRRARKQGFELLTIHDAFFASPNYMNQVRQNYIDILAEIADMNLLETILNQITGTNQKLTRLSTDLSKFIRQSQYSLS